jgi:hypothetical protein
MVRVALGLVAGLLGGVGGALAVRGLAPCETEVAPAPGGDRVDRLLDAVAAIQRRLDAAGPAPLAASSPAAGGGGAPSLAAASSLASGAPSAGPGAAYAAGGGDLEALVSRAAEKAAEAVLARQGEAKAAADREAEKKPATLAQVAHDLGLSASQETEIREAYRDSTERMLRLVAEPDGDPEALRRELLEARGNQAKRTALMLKHMPKVMGKLPDFMGIQAERESRIHKALGSEENVAKYGRYEVAEEDPFGFSGTRVSVGARTPR